MTVSSTDGDAGNGAAAIETTTDVTTASSSDAETNQAKGSLQDAVNSALKIEQEAPPASNEQDPKGSASESTEEAEVSEEEMKQFSERTQRRFRELVGKKKEAEGQVAEVRQELEAIKPKAQRMDEIVGFMQSNGITPDHFNNALGLTAMINKGDYQSAVPILENLLAQVRNAAGEVLSPDLQEQVRLGYITEAHAKELQKTKVGKARAEKQIADDRTKQETERHQAEVNQLVQTATTAGDAWSKEQAQTDPDWNLKRDRVTEKMELELHRVGPAGYPRTEKAVREMLDNVKKQVEADIKRFLPKPKPIDPSPTGGSASPRSKAKPASLKDAVNQALAG